MSPGFIGSVRSAATSLAEACQRSRDAYGYRESGPWHDFKEAFHELIRTPLNQAGWDEKRNRAREKFLDWKQPKGGRTTARERRGWNIQAIENFLTVGQIQPVDPIRLATLESQRQQSLKQLFLTPSGRRFKLPSMATVGAIAVGAATRADAVNTAAEDYMKARRGLLEEDSAESQAAALAVEQGAGIAGGRFAGLFRGRARGSEEAQAETVSQGLQRLYKSLPTPTLPKMSVWRPGPDYFRSQVEKIAEHCAGKENADVARQMVDVFMSLDFTGAYNAAFNGLNSLSDIALKQVPGIASLFKLKAFCEAMGSLLGELSTRRQVRRNLQKRYYRPGQVSQAIETLQVIIERSVCTKGVTAARAGMTFAISVAEAAAAGTQIATTIVNLVDAAVAALQYLADIAISVYDCVTANMRLAAWESHGSSTVHSDLDADAVSQAEADVLGNPALAAVLLAELDDTAVINVAFDLMATPNFTDIVSKVVEKGSQVKAVARHYVEALPMQLDPPFQGWGANSQANAAVNGPPPPPPQPSPAPLPDPTPPGGIPSQPGGSVAVAVQEDLVRAVEEEFIASEEERRRIGENLVTALAAGVAQAVRAYEQTLGRSGDETTGVRAGRQLGGFGIRTFAKVSEESAAAVNYFKSPDFAGDLQRCKADGDFRPLYDYLSNLCGEPLQFPPDTSARFSQKKLRPLNKDGRFRSLLVEAVTNPQAMTCLEQLAGF